MKRGQTNTISVTIAIVLGIALIVFLIWGFSTNWAMFTSVTEIHTGKVNIDLAKQACKLNCDNNQEIAFCDVKKPVTYLVDGEVESGSYSCGELSVILNDDDFKCDNLCVFAEVGRCEGDDSEKCEDADSEQDCLQKQGCGWETSIEKVS